MTSWDSSVSFHINYSRLDRISRLTHTHMPTCGRKESTLIQSDQWRVVVSLFEIQHSQRPISLFFSASWIHYRCAHSHSYNHIHHTCLPYLTTYNFFPREPQYGCWWPSLVSLFLSLPHSTCCIHSSSTSHCVFSQTRPLFGFVLILLFSSLSHSSKPFFSFLFLTYAFMHCFLCLPSCFSSAPPPLFICHSFLITPSLCFISIQSKKMALGVICASRRWQNGGRHQRSQRSHQPPNLHWCLPVTHSRSCMHHTYLQRAGEKQGNMYP